MHDTYSPQDFSSPAQPGLDHRPQALEKPQLLSRAARSLPIQTLPAASAHQGSWNFLASPPSTTGSFHPCTQLPQPLTMLFPKSTNVPTAHPSRKPSRIACARPVPYCTSPGHSCLDLAAFSSHCLQVNGLVFSAGNPLESGTVSPGCFATSPGGISNSSDLQKVRARGPSGVIGPGGSQTLASELPRGPAPPRVSNLGGQGWYPSWC